MTVQPTVSDDLLIRQFKDGKSDAFNALYERHLSSVFNRVRYVIPEADVEDVTQEVFIAAFQSLPSFRGEAQFGTWLRTLTNHKVAEYYRKRNRRQEAPQAALAEAAPHSEGHSGKILEEQIALRTALQEIPEPYREVILLRFAEGLQFNEIAALTGQNLEAVKSLFRRAMAALRKHLDEGP